MAARRPAIDRLGLFAWLSWIALAFVVSFLPFLFEVRLWEAGGDAYWGCKHGSVYRASVERSSVNPVRGEDLWLVEWSPGTRASLEFQWGPSRNVEPRPTPRSRPFVRGAPPWAVLLMPTLLVILLARPARFLAERVPVWLQRLGDRESAERRALLAAGRLPCPNCDYDVTGLERCPECGTPSRAVRATPLRRLRPARLALVLWLGLAGAAALMPFLFVMYWSSGPVSIGAGEGTCVLAFDRGYKQLTSYGYTHPNGVDLRPGVLYMFTFDAGWTHNFKYVQFPPWLVVLVPTLVAMAIGREVRYSKRRAIRKRGRTLCPACQYDATGLEVCPECGAAVVGATAPASRA